MKRTVVVLNPHAAGSPEFRDDLEQLAGRHMASLLAPDHWQSALDEAIRYGARRVVVCGGDGTISRVVNALGDDLDGVEIGVVPLGTGNDLARSLGIADWSLETAFDAAVDRPAVLIDLVEVHESGPDSHRDFRFVNAATGGFGAEVTAALSAEAKQMFGAFAYWLAATSKLIDMRQFTLELTLDQEQLKTTAFGLTVANGRFVGGGFPVASQAFLDDGLLDLVVVPPMSSVELLAAGATYVLGMDSAAPGVLTRQVRQLSIRATPPMPFSFDGEPTITLDIALRVLPRVLRVVAGDDAAIRSPT